MNWLKESAEQWVIAWLQIFDCLFSIFTLGFCYCNFVGWFYGNIAYPTLAAPMSINKRITSWFYGWVRIFEELMTILTLGQFRTPFFSVCYHCFTRFLRS